jgi:DNA-binding IclR family transcriptional regulator
MVRHTIFSVEDVLDDPNEASSDIGSQTVARALTLLKCFSPQSSQRSLTELSKETGLTVPTTHRLLRTLTTRGFLVVDTKTKRYSLGPAVMQMAGAVVHRGSLLAEILPQLEALRRDSGESAGLHALVGDGRVCLVEMVSHNPLKMTSGVGHQYPLHRGAAGRILLAHLPEVEREAYLTRFGTVLTSSQSEIQEELAKCREAGFALSSGEVVPGAVAVAAAICDATGYPLAAVNVTGPAERWTPERADEFGPRILTSISDLESRLGLVLDL